MHATSVSLLLVAAGAVGFLHSILPDHWVPLALVARTRRWSILRTARVSLLASIGHVLTSIILAGIIALIGLQFRNELESEQSHIVGSILVLTGVGFVILGLAGGDRSHHEHHHSDAGSEHHLHHHGHPDHPFERRTAAGRLAAIVVPFGAAASPDLTVLPVALAASAISAAAVGGVIITFSLVTLATFVGLTVAATLAGYQVKGQWLEEHSNSITGAVLVLIGLAVFTNLV